MARRHHARVTISDVAVRAGVSPMTVSRVINSEGNVRGSTRAAVDAAIRELGYLLARSIRASRAARDTECEHLTLDYSLVTRESSAPPARRVPRDRIT